MDLDTKKLLDLLYANGIAPVHDYGEGLTYSNDAEDNCVEIWRREMLMNHDVLREYLVDFIITAL